MTRLRSAGWLLIVAVASGCVSITSTVPALPPAGSVVYAIDLAVARASLMDALADARGIDALVEDPAGVSFDVEGFFGRISLECVADPGRSLTGLWPRFDVSGRRFGVSPARIGRTLRAMATVTGRVVQALNDASSNRWQSRRSIRASDACF